jgi:hypothetical protein
MTFRFLRIIFIGKYALFFNMPSLCNVQVVRDKQSILFLNNFDVRLKWLLLF